MKFKKTVCIAAMVLALCLSSCGSNGSDAPPPDLTGEWKQMSEDSTFYQIASITGDTIETYWYVVADESVYLYWTGTFTPPEDGKEPYTWQSVNDIEKAETSPWAMRDGMKSFTYKDGKISYIVRMGNLSVSVALERLPEDEHLPLPE